MTEAARGRWARTRAALTPREWRRAAWLAAAIVALHAVGLFLLLVLVVPHGFRIGSAGFGIGLGATAYALGLRHAFDVDHIAAIDNTTRKLMADGQRPLSVGFFFSLGHSTVVFMLACGLALGLKGLDGAVTHSTSTLHEVTDVIGPVVSGAFLLLIGLLNVGSLVSTTGVLRRARRGDCSELELEQQLGAGGVMSRICGRATRSVRRPWQMYPLGFLFGLGFDTATEVALLFLAAGAALNRLPFYAILCLPILFAAGMSLLDTLDGAFMNFAYGWAFSQPVRKLYYNLTVTGLSVAVALVIGSIELLSVLVNRLNLTGSPWSSLAAVNLNSVGYIVVGAFVVTWAIAVAAWRVGRLEERWTVAVAGDHDDQPIVRTAAELP
ncbi:MAG: HoxN/HupN/NixA family nickel/cobalt transporter [Solirubrobacteraceae bacterium]|jgi:high-affinity nickel-transport protein